MWQPERVCIFRWRSKIVRLSGWAAFAADTTCTVANGLVWRKIWWRQSSHILQKRGEQSLKRVQGAYEEEPAFRAKPIQYSAKICNCCMRIAAAASLSATLPLEATQCRQKLNIAYANMLQSHCHYPICTCTTGVEMKTSRRQRARIQKDTVFVLGRCNVISL